MTRYNVPNFREMRHRFDGIEAESPDAAANRLIIPAEAHSDDFAIQVGFDALPWFEQASNKEILCLARCGWGGDYPADRVAYSLEETVPELGRFFAYLAIIADDLAKRDCHGFECRIQEPPALEWLKRNRHDIWTELTGSQPYSVLLLYPDYANDCGTETYFALVVAADPIEAVAAAQRQASAVQESLEIEPDDFAPLLVVAGHHISEPLFNK